MRHAVQSRPITRRTVVRGVAVALAGPILAACQSAPPTQAPAPTAAPAKPAAPANAAAATAATKPAVGGAAAPAATTAPAPAAPATKPAGGAPAGPTTAAGGANRPNIAPPPAGVKVVEPTAEPPGKKGGVVTSFYWTENPPTLDPYLNVSFRSQTFAGAFYSRLLRSKKGPGIGSHAYIMEGDLAESWQPSEDGLTWTFNLRKTARWHNKPPLNGRPVVAKDVTQSFERFMKVSPQRTTFDIVAEVSAPNDGTVVFKLKQGFAPFEAAVGSPIFWVISPEVIAKDGDASKTVVGSGPYLFDRFESGVQIAGKRNPDHYIPNEPNADFVSPIIPDTATQLAAVRSGQLDFYAPPATELANLAKSNPELRWVENPNLSIPFMYWKVNAPPFNDARVRQAFSMMINRDDYIKVIHNGRGEYNNAIPWALSEAWLNPRGADQGASAKYFKYDPAEAKKLLDAAGWDWQKPVPMLSTTGYGQVFVQAVELVASHLKQAGVNVQLKMQEYTVYISGTFAGKFDPGTIVWGLETPFTGPHDYLFNMHHPKGTRNHAGVNDTKLTEMIDQQARTVDKAKRKQLIYDIQKYLGEQMYYPPGTAGVVSTAIQPWVRNFFPISDYGQFSEVCPKIWIDK